MIIVKRPFVQYGFWWWFNPELGDWLVGPSPAIGYPPWWKWKEWKLEKKKS